MRYRIGVAILTLATACFITRAFAQSSLNIPVREWGISIGNSPKFNGIRLNFRDHRLEQIRGLNLTLWKPEKNGRGRIDGVGVGAYGSGAAELRGVFAGGIAVQARKSIQGLAFGGLGLGAGREISGLAIAGLGMGSGGAIRGIAIGGLGLGAGGDITGLAN